MEQGSYLQNTFFLQNIETLTLLRAEINGGWGGGLNAPPGLFVGPEGLSFHGHTILVLRLKLHINDFS